MHCIAGVMGWPPSRFAATRVHRRRRQQLMVPWTVPEEQRPIDASNKAKVSDDGQMRFSKARTKLYCGAPRAGIGRAVPAKATPNTALSATSTAFCNFPDFALFAGGAFGGAIKKVLFPAADAATAELEAPVFREPFFTMTKPELTAPSSSFKTKWKLTLIWVTIPQFSSAALFNIFYSAW